MDWLPLRLTLAFFVFVCPLIPQQPSVEPVIRVSVDLVQVDVTVTDSNGRHIAGSHPEDFEIEEDGKVQNLGIAASDIAKIKTSLKNLVENQMMPGDLVSIVTTSGGMGALQKFTNDKRQLYAAIERIRWFPGRVGDSPFEAIADGDSIKSHDMQRINRQVAVLNLARAHLVAENTNRIRSVRYSRNARTPRPKGARADLGRIYDLSGRVREPGQAGELGWGGSQCSRRPWHCLNRTYGRGQYSGPKRFN